MASSEDTVRTYGAAWNEPDREKRLALLAKVWSAESRYIDPRVEVTGPDALSGYIDAVHEAMPGARLDLEGEIEEHHGHLRFRWVLVGADGKRLLPGIDFAILAPDGKLARVVGFYDSPDEDAS